MPEIRLHEHRGASFCTYAIACALYRNWAQKSGEIASLIRPSPIPGRLLLPQHQIDHPAASNMLARLAAVAEDVGVIAAGVFEGVGEDR